MAYYELSSSTSLGYTLKLQMTETVQASQNRSKIDWALVLYSGGYNFSQFACGWSVKIGDYTNSQARSGAPDLSIAKNSSATICSGTAYITHEGDGSKTISVSANDDINKYRPDGVQITAGNQYLSGSITLTKINRASTLTIPTLNIGQSVGFTINRAVNTYTHTLSYAFGSQTGTIGTGLTTSATWTIPEAFLDDLPSSISGPGTLTLTTYDGATLIGSITYDVSFVVPASYVPSITGAAAAPSNTNAWLASEGLFVAGYSAITVSATVTPPRGATAALRITGDAGEGQGSPWTSQVLSSAGTKTITLTATDSRGRTATATLTVTFLSYTNPGISSISFERGTYSGGVWTPDASNGDHIKVTAVGSVSLMAQNNDGELTFYCTGEASQTVHSLSGTVYFTGTSAEQVYSVTAEVTDLVGNTGASSLTVPTVEVPLCWDDDRIGIGKIAQNAGYLEIAYKVLMEATLELGGVTLPDDTEADKFLKMNSAGTGLEWGAGVSWEDIYPVGAIYLSTSSTSPQSLFGGTWTAINDVFLLTAGSTYTAGDTGGEATHTLDTSEVPAHSHTGKYVNGVGANNGSIQLPRMWAASGDGSGTLTNSVGGGGAHNNMPPYLVVYAWERTA